ncbi:MAG: epoxyqueuosine reductase [Clostridia bacterium]|nr:epoxyqueuosine reductase [Clostridia bacterium]
MQNYQSIVKDFFEKWKIEYYGTVDYTSLREINPRIRERIGLVPRSATVFIIPYFLSRPKNFSAYAASRDYHIFVKEICDALTAELMERYPEYKFAGFGDHSPIDERHAALVAGLGVLGENELLINEKYGSYVFIASILSDMPPSLTEAMAAVEINKCIGCGACKRACPTGVLTDRCESCLSAITQRKGELSEHEVELMRKFDTVWGCDVCQRVCPYNKTAQISPVEFFRDDRVELLTSEYVSSLSDEEFSRRAFAWRGKKTVLRNLELLKY